MTSGFAGLRQVTLTSQRRHAQIAVAAHLNHALSKLAGHYFITCDSEGKTLSNVRGYNE